MRSARGRAAMRASVSFLRAATSLMGSGLLGFLRTTASTAAMILSCESRLFLISAGDAFIAFMMASDCLRMTSFPGTPGPASITTNATSGLRAATIGAMRAPSECPMNPILVRLMFAAVLRKRCAPSASFAKSLDVPVAWSPFDKPTPRSS